MEISYINPRLQLQGPTQCEHIPRIHSNVTVTLAAPFSVPDCFFDAPKLSTVLSILIWGSQLPFPCP